MTEPLPRSGKGPQPQGQGKPVRPLPKPNTAAQPPPGTRLILAAEDLLSLFGTRTEDGELITAEWGEPNERGWYEPTFTVHTDDRIGALDAAWAAVVAALPEGWVIDSIQRPNGGAWEADASVGWSVERGRHVQGSGPTPAAALLALLAKLKERTP